MRPCSLYCGLPKSARSLKIYIPKENWKGKSFSRDSPPNCWTSISIWLCVCLQNFSLSTFLTQNANNYGLCEFKGQIGASPICFQVFHFFSRPFSCIPSKTPFTVLGKRVHKAANLVPCSTVMLQHANTLVNSASLHVNPGYLSHSHLIPTLS